MVGVAASAAVAWACLKPTQITLRLTTDVACSELRSTSIYNGNATGAEAVPFTTTTDCTDGPSRTIGTLVLAPSGSKSDTVTVTVVAGVGVPSEACTAANNFHDCIVARRRVRYAEHEPLELPVFLANSCRGILCPDGQTCVPCEKEPCTANATPLCAPLAAVDVCDQPGANCAPAPLPDGGGLADAPAPPVAPREDAAGAIDAALPDGGAIVFRRLVSSPEQVYGLAFADGDLYWTRQGSLWRASLASLLSNADAGAQVAAPQFANYRGVDVSSGIVGLALEASSPCAIAFPVGSVDASVSVHCGSGGLGKGLALIGTGSTEGLVSTTTGGLIHWLADGGRGELTPCLRSYLRVIQGPPPSSSGLTGKLMVRGISEVVEVAAFGDLAPGDVSTPGKCALKEPGPSGQSLVSLAVTPRVDKYVTTKSGEVFKRSSTGPWTPFGGVTLAGAEDILVVPSANGAELQILVAAGDGVYIAENVPDRPL